MVFNVPVQHRFFYGAVIGAALPFVLYGGLGASICSRISAIAQATLANLTAPVVAATAAEQTLLGMVSTCALWSLGFGIGAYFLFNFVEGDQKLKYSYIVSAVALIGAVVIGLMAGLSPALTAFFMCVTLGNAYVEDMNSRGYFSFYPTQPKVRPEDIAGRDNLMEGVTEFINSYLSKDFTPRILLLGPPGTGKSCLAEAVATALGRPFIKIKNADLHAADPADRKERIQVLIAKARASKAVVLFEEFDVVGRDRTQASDNQLRDEVTLLMGELDELNKPNPDNDFIIFATTNYADAIDSAVSREGRFDLKLPVLHLNTEEIGAVIDRYAVQYQLTSAQKGQVQEMFKEGAVTPAAIETECRKLSLVEAGHAQ